MKYICVQPDVPYFHWQLQILDQNMKKYEMFKDSISILIYDKTPSQFALDYQLKSGKSVILIKDERSVKHRSYIPSIKPYGMKWFMKYCFHLIDGHNVFYHDCDILFTKKLNWDLLIKDPKVCYMSDTISYIGSHYIVSKSPSILTKMAEIVGIDENIVAGKVKKSGGAQYIFGKDIKMTYEFWDKIENDSVKLYGYTSSPEVKLLKGVENIYPIQAWTSEMWSQLWNTWLYGWDSEVIREMDFCWPMNPLKEAENKAIFHNSGVTDKHPTLFNKSKYIANSPFGEDFSWVDNKTCSSLYTVIISEISPPVKKEIVQLEGNAKIIKNE